MKLFLSAGEPSGDLHGANLIRAILSRQPHTEITALGGSRMREAGAKILYPLTELAVMGLNGIFTALPKFFEVGNYTIQHIRKTKPDAVVMIDYPGFHLALAKRLREYGVPTYFFVPPQIWAWKQWRVRTVRKCFDCVLTALPFEDEWFRERHVNTHYIGHPYFDELSRQYLDPAFLAAECAKPGTRIAILPGSRNREVAANTEMMFSAARKIHAARPDTRFLVAAFNEKQANSVRAVLPAGVPIDVHVGRTPEIIELAETCVAVSGSVGLELMYRVKPTVVVFRMDRIGLWLVRQMVKIKHISIVNLLADERLYPEIGTSRDESDFITEHTLGWLNDPAKREALVNRLTDLRARVAQPGACERAAEFLLGDSVKQKLAAA
jgi:lipid-A-disaccharide synthase